MDRPLPLANHIVHVRPGPVVAAALVALAVWVMIIVAVVAQFWVWVIAN